MAPKKKPSMLQRQRQLRAQQQQVKKASSNQLPPKGGSSGNSRQARAQRTGTLKTLAANQQRVIARGMEGFIRRGQAQDKLDKAAKGSTNPGTRTAGAGGGLAKRPSSSVQRRAGTQPSSSGGSRQAPGGRVQRSGSGSASSNRVEQVRVRDLGSNPPNRMGGGAQRALPPGRSGGAITRAGGTARAAAGAAGGAGRFLGALGTALAIPSAIKNIADVAERNRQWEAYKERMGMNQKTPAQTGGTRRGAAAGTRTRPSTNSSTSSGPDWRSRVSSSNVDALRQGQNDTIRSYNNTPASRPSAPRPSQSTPSSRTTSGGSSSQRQTVAPKAAKPAMPGRKWEDFNPGRGTSKSNNPLLDRDSGGIKLRDRMKDREATQQAEKAKSLQSKFGEDSGYQPQTKVDGSKYADKKPDMNKVNEYVRRKRRYYD